jgi:plastocyanin
MRIIACACAAALAAILAPASGSGQQTAASANESETITVRLSNFAFEPNHLRFKAGTPIRLRLVNDSGGGHDFSAPSFFAASSVMPGSAAPPDGKLAVGSHQTIEIAVVPHVPGTYRIECTHFLHSFFGMHGSVEVTP